MFDLPQALQLFLTITGLGGTFAIAFSIFTVTKYTSTIKFNESTILAYKERTDLLQKQYDEEKQERKKQQLQLLELEKKLSELQGRLGAYQELIKNPDGLTLTLQELNKSVKMLTDSARIADEARKFMQDFREGKIGSPNVTVVK